MLNYGFKTCISKNRELYFLMEREPEYDHTMVRDVAFPESLLALVYMDTNDLPSIFKKISDDLWSLTLTHDKKFAEEAEASLDALALRHIYFEFIRLDWRCRITRACALGDYSENLLHRASLLRMAETIVMMQEQIKDLFAHVLDADGEDSAVPDKLAAYYLSAGSQAFQFQPQPMNFELLNEEVFAEVLCPATVYDLIDYHLRECIKREIKMRVCKNCGKYFAVTGHGGTEYCDRPFDEKGRTCKEIGAFRVWEKSKSEDKAFKAFRKEYKKRFAWIKAGRITKEEFYAWSERARAKRDDCDEGKLTLEEFTAWLADS